MKKPKIWALVADGERARLLSGLEGDAPAVMLELTTAAPTHHLGEMMADHAGRSFTSSGTGRRSAMEPGSDPVRRDMQDFARAMFETLEKHRRDGAFDRLAIFAAPKMLGILRDEMPSGLKDRVILERSANLLWQSEPELIGGVREALAELPRL